MNGLLLLFLSSFALCVAVLAIPSASAALYHLGVASVSSVVQFPYYHHLQSGNEASHQQQHQEDNNKDHRVATPLNNKAQVAADPSASTVPMTTTTATTITDAPIQWIQIPESAISTEDIYKTSFDLHAHSYRAFQVTLAQFTEAMNVEIVVNLEETAICEQDIYANSSLLAVAPPHLLDWEAPSTRAPTMSDLGHALLVVPVMKSMQCAPIHDVQRSFQNIAPGSRNSIYIVIQSLMPHRSNHSSSNGGSADPTTTTTTTTTTTQAPSGGSGPRCSVNLFVRAHSTAKWEMQTKLFLLGLALVAFGVPFGAILFVGHRARSAAAALAANGGDIDDEYVGVVHFALQRRIGYAEVAMFVPSLLFYTMVRAATRAATAVYECVRTTSRKARKNSHRNKSSGGSNNSSKNGNGSSSSSSSIAGRFFCCGWLSCCCCCDCDDQKRKEQEQQQQQQTAGNTGTIRRHVQSQSQPGSPVASMTDISPAAAATTTTSDDSPRAAADDQQPGQQQQQQEEEDEEILCRICADDDSEEELIQPCSCNSWVHQSCLDRWRVQSTNERVQRNSACEICLTPYRVPVSRAVVMKVFLMRVLYFAVFVLASYIVLVFSFGLEVAVSAPMACAAPFERAFTGPLSEVGVYVLGGFSYLSLTVLSYVAVQASWLIWFNRPLDIVIQQEEQQQPQDDAQQQDEQEQQQQQHDGNQVAVPPATAPVTAPATEDAIVSGAASTIADSDAEEQALIPPQPAAGAAAAAAQQDDDNQQQQRNHHDHHAVVFSARRLRQHALQERLHQITEFYQSWSARLWFLVFMLWQFDTVIFVCFYYKWLVYQNVVDLAWSWSVPFPVLILVIPVAMLLFILVGTCRACYLRMSGQVVADGVNGRNAMWHGAGGAADLMDDDSDDEAHGDGNQAGGDGDAAAAVSPEERARVIADAEEHARLEEEQEREQERVARERQRQHLERLRSQREQQANNNNDDGEDVDTARVTVN